MTTEEGRLQVGISTEFLDTTIVEQSDGSEAHREGVFIGDPETTAARAAVNKGALTTDYGGVTRDPLMVDLVMGVNAMVAEQRRTNRLLEAIFDMEGFE
jgi:hypothetical protein